MRAAVLAAAVFTAGCGGSGGYGGLDSSGKLEIDQSVTDTTAIKSGGVRVGKGSTRGDVRFEPYIRVDLKVPDGSPVLQFTTAKADIEVVCERSSQSVTGISCDMEVRGGVRSFGFRQELSAEQAKSLQKVVVKRVYQ